MMIACVGRPTVKWVSDMDEQRSANRDGTENFDSIERNTRGACVFSNAGLSNVCHPAVSVSGGN
jgi:hypothetical protein